MHVYLWPLLFKAHSFPPVTVHCNRGTRNRQEIQRNKEESHSSRFPRCFLCCYNVCGRQRARIFWIAVLPHYPSCNVGKGTLLLFTWKNTETTTISPKGEEQTKAERNRLRFVLLSMTRVFRFVWMSQILFICTSGYCFPAVLHF